MNEPLYRNLQNIDRNKAGKFWCELIWRFLAQNITKKKKKTHFEEMPCES